MNKFLQCNAVVSRDKDKINKGSNKLQLNWCVWGVMCFCNSVKPTCRKKNLQSHHVHKVRAVLYIYNIYIYIYFFFLYREK